MPKKSFTHVRPGALIAWLWPVGAWILMACTASAPATGALPTSTARALPPRYLSPTPSATATRPAWPTGTLPRPTPTPLVYTVQKGDTLSGIALRFGVPVDVLRKANPGLNPNAMPVGATLVIPLDPTYMPGPPTPTPPSELHLGPVACYPEGTGGAWCFALVENPTQQAWMHILARLEVLTWGTAATPAVRSVRFQSLALHLPAGQSLPLVAHLPPPWPGFWQARGVLERALPLEPNTQQARFSPVTWSQPTLTWGPYRGWVRLETEWRVGEEAAWVRLVAWATDGRNRVAAARAWTWPGPWKAGAEEKVTVYLYSAGPQLDAVHLWVEGVRASRP